MRWTKQLPEFWSGYGTWEEVLGMEKRPEDEAPAPDPTDEELEELEELEDEEPEEKKDAE